MQKQYMNIWAVSSGRRDSSGMPAKEVRCLTWDCPRNSWTVAGMGSGLSMRARAGDHWEGAPGRCAKASRKDKWADASAGSARWRAGAGSGSQVLLQLLEGPPAGAGQRALSTRRITSAPGAAVDAIPPPRAGHGASRAARSSPATARCGGPGTRGIRSRPLAPPREERPGHHQDPRSNHAVRRCALLPPRTPTPSARSRATCGSRSTSSSTHPAPTRKPIGWGADKAGRRKHLRDGPRTPWTGCQPPTP